MILLFSLSAYIIMWDAQILSELISISLMALLIAVWLWLAGAWQWYKVVSLVAIPFFWVFTRDTNAYTILMIAGILVIVGGCKAYL
jgi:hypothetical protein